MTDILMKLTVGGNTHVVLGPTHEEVITDAVRDLIRSYKQLPQEFFQITDYPEPALTAFGFYADQQSQQTETRKLHAALLALLRQCRISPLSIVTAEADELVALCPTGDTRILLTDSLDYVATTYDATTAPRAWGFAGDPIAPLEQILTPNLNSVADVCAILKISPDQILKTRIFAADSPIAIRWVVAVVRGDHHVNVSKLENAAETMGVTSIHLADEEKSRSPWPLGFVGPDAVSKVPDAVLIVDPDAAQGERAWYAGGNQPHTHVRNFNWFRETGDRLADPTRVSVADIRDAVEGDPSPTGSGPLHLRHADSLAYFTTPVLEAPPRFIDFGGHSRPLQFSICNLDLLQILMSMADASHDEHGLIFPPAIAPCSVVITPVHYDGPTRDAADALYTRLTYEGVDVILDDRDARPGSKFADADLIGFPLRITLGPKTLQHSQAELKRRSSPNPDLVNLDAIPARVAQAIMDL